MCVVFTVAVAAEPSIVQFNVSPFVNDVDVLLVPDVSYFTNNVSGSVPSVADVPTTLAITPDEAPVNLTLSYFVMSEIDLADNFTE